MTKEQEDAMLDDPKPAKSYGVNPANTPRTDAATIPCGWDTTDPVVKKTFAQGLEREIADLRVALAAMGSIAESNAAQEQAVRLANQIDKALALVNEECPAMDDFTNIVPTVEWLIQKWRECRRLWSKSCQYRDKLREENQRLRDHFSGLIYSAERAADLIISVSDRYDIDVAIESAKAVLPNAEVSDAGRAETPTISGQNTNAPGVRLH
jgi:hypothetical protein